ncbi:MAG: hypothetical protein AAF352_03345, partial [Pseudomonadota bacterium]
MARNLVAILRGVTPDEVIAIADIIYDAGIEMIEVPLNSPQPFESIAKLAGHFGDRAIIGAGTYLPQHGRQRDDHPKGLLTEIRALQADRHAQQCALA